MHQRGSAPRNPGAFNSPASGPPQKPVRGERRLGGPGATSGVRWFVTKARSARMDPATVASVVGHDAGNITDDVHSGGPDEALLRAAWRQSGCHRDGPLLFPDTLPDQMFGRRGTVRCRY